MHTYSTSDISYLLQTDRQNINLYISKNQLNAIKVDGNWQITHNDYISFREEYYDTNARHSNRGACKRLTDTDIEQLSSIISDIQNKEFSLHEFKTRYVDKPIWNIKQLIIFKRDSCIQHDSSQHKLTYKDLAYQYGLSIKTIGKILNTKKEDAA